MPSSLRAIQVDGWNAGSWTIAERSVGRSVGRLVVRLGCGVTTSVHVLCVLSALVCRRLKRKKEQSLVRKRSRQEDKCGGFARLRGTTTVNIALIITHCKDNRVIARVVNRCKRRSKHYLDIVLDVASQLASM